MELGTMPRLLALALCLTVFVCGGVSAGEDPNEDHDSRLFELTSGTGWQTIDHSKFHTLSKIGRSLIDLFAKYRSNVKFIRLPHRTTEDRDMYAWKLTTDSSAGHNHKRSIMIEGGIHAREWISPASILYVMDKMLRQYSQSASPGFDMIDNFDWYFLPVANPDGYHYTTTASGEYAYNTRMWRKNRLHISEDCWGVDLNRNFDADWGTGREANQRCRSDTYPGSRAGSEMETQNIMHLFNEAKASLRAYIPVHSYGQLLIFPWDKPENEPTNKDSHIRLCASMAASVLGTSGRNFSCGTNDETLKYTTSGTSDAWAMSQKDGLFSISIELLPDSRENGGFQVRKNKIVDSGKDLLNMLKAVADHIVAEDDGATAGK